MQRIVIIALTGCAFLALDRTARAGLYHQDTIAAFDLDDKGYANPLDPNMFMTMINIIKSVDDRTSTEAKDLLKAVAEREKAGTSKPQDLVNLAADLLRLRDDASRSRAMNLLQPLTRRPPSGYEFMILTLQAYAHAVREEYQDAAVLADSALNDYDFPKQLLTLSPEQLAWYRRFERVYYLPFLRQRSRNAKATVRDSFDPIFPTPSKSKEKLQPVRFAGEGGKYEAGTIATAEKAKLPPDAVAIVQQLILWHPDDGRLWWLLAELYNAVGDIKASARIFDQCTRELKYTNRELMDHRSVVMAAVDAQFEIEAKLAEARKKAEEEKKLQAQVEERRRIINVAIGVCVVVVIIGYWQFREFIRRMQRNRAKAAPPTTPHE